VRTRVFRLVVTLELDDGPPKELLRTEYPVVDDDVARRLAAARLDKFAESYPVDRLRVAFAEVNRVVKGSEQ